MGYEANSIIGLGDEVDVKAETIQALQEAAVEELDAAEQKFVEDLQVVFDEFGVAAVTAENVVKERHVDLSYVPMTEEMLNKVVEALPPARAYARVLYVWKPVVNFTCSRARAIASSKNWSISTHR